MYYNFRDASAAVALPAKKRFRFRSLTGALYACFTNQRTNGGVQNGISQLSKEGEKHAILNEKLERPAAETPASQLIQNFENEFTPAVHPRPTAQEERFEFSLAGESVPQISEMDEHLARLTCRIAKVEFLGIWTIGPKPLVLFNGPDTILGRSSLAVPLDRNFSADAIRRKYQLAEERFAIQGECNVESPDTPA